MMKKLLHPGFQFQIFLASILRDNPDFRNVQTEVRITDRYIADIVAEERIDNYWKELIIEVKFFSTFTAPRVNSIIKQLGSILNIDNRDYNVVLSFPGVLPTADNNLLKKHNIIIWDKPFINKRFNSEIGKSYETNFKQFFSQISPQLPDVDIVGDLKAIPPGEKHWSLYQKHIGTTMELLFSRELSSPISESSDKLSINRRDFVLRNYSECGFWRYLRDQYKADFIVVDAKNYKGKIKKDQILQITNYLKYHGTGLFAIIFSRNGEEDTGSYYTRREKWILENKMVIILGDADVERMVKAFENNASPEELIRQKIEDFRLGI